MTYNDNIQDEGRRMDLPRQHLLDRVREARNAQLILIQAPAGYGKSTLLRQLADDALARGERVAWISPVSQDADMSRFMQLFQAACDRLAEGASVKSKKPSRDMAAWLGAVSGPALFLFDEYDQIHDPQVDAQVEQIIARLPPGKRIAIATRVLPDISSARLKLSGKAIVLGSIDLRFDVGEAYQFLSEHARLGLEEVRRLHSRVDGWPAALQFIKLATQSQGRNAASVFRSGLTAELVDYLAQEVFSMQPDSVKQMLLRICLPQRICDRLAIRLMRSQDNPVTVENLCRRGLFLDPVDGDRLWFRFHPVFGDFLKARLEESVGADALAGIHSDIAEWFSGENMHEMAVGHYLAAGRFMQAADCLEQVVDRLIREERLGLVVSLLEQFDFNILRHKPRLVEAAVIAYGFRREFAKAHRLIDWCEEYLAEQNAGNAERAELDVRRCFVLAAEDRVEEMGTRARNAESWLGDNRPFLAAVALNASAFWLGTQSQFVEAEELLLRARPLHQKAGSFFGQSYGDSILGSLKLARGRAVEAVEHLRAALRDIVRDAPPGSLAGGVLAAHLGDALYERDEIHEAEEVVGSYLPLIEQQCIVDPLCLGMVVLARIAILRGKTETAHDLYEQLISNGHKYGLARLVTYGRAELAREATLNGDFEAAERRLRALGPEARLPLDEHPIFVSGELEAQRVTYARLLVHSGKQAEARAILQAEVRAAAQKRRTRRLVRLKTLLAISLEMDGQLPSARRVMVETVGLAAPGGLRRTILDEGPAALRLLNHLVAENFVHQPQWADDPVAAYTYGLIERTEGSNVGATAEAAIGVVEDGAVESLTQREIEILNFLARGHSNKDLADRLAVSQNTIKFHLRNVFAKLSANNRMQAVQAARHFKLIT